jgi:hypothetical protein
MPDVIFILRTTVNAQDLDLPQVDEMLLFSEGWERKDIYYIMQKMKRK